MKPKTLLVLCFVSLAIDWFGGAYLVRDINILLNPTPNDFNWVYTIISDLTWFLESFWKFGFPIFFGCLFTKTSKTTWWMWIVAAAALSTELLGSLDWWEVYPQQLWWWREAKDWIWDSLSFLTSLGWIFYGGLIFQKLTKGVDFTNFSTSASWTNFKNWYVGLIEDKKK